MAFLYDFGRSSFLLGDIEWDTASVRLSLLDSTYTPAASHTTRASGSPSVDAATVTNGNDTVDSRTDPGGDGIADAADVVYESPAPSGGPVDQMVMYVHVDGVAANDTPLIASWASGDVTNFPLTLTGGTVTIQWQSTGDLIFKL